MCTQGTLEGSGTALLAPRHWRSHYASNFMRADKLHLWCACWFSGMSKHALAPFDALRRNGEVVGNLLKELTPGEETLTTEVDAMRPRGEWREHQVEPIRHRWSIDPCADAEEIVARQGDAEGGRTRGVATGARTKRCGSRIEIVYRYPIDAGMKLSDRSGLIT